MLPALLLLLISACGTTTTSEEKASVPASPASFPESSRDPIKEALQDEAGENTKFYLSNNLEPFYFSATYQPAAGLSVSTNKARELVPRIKTLTRSANHTFVFETLLATQNMAGAAYEDMSDAASGLYNWQMQRKKSGVQTENSHLQLAIAAVRLKRFPLAQYHLDQARMFKNAAHADIENIQGILALKQDRLDEALRHWREALRLDSNHLPARLNFGTTALALGDFQSADRYLAGINHEAAQQAMIAVNRMAEVAPKANALCRRLLQKKFVAKPVIYNCALNTWQGMEQGSIARRELQQLAQSQQLPPLLETKVFSSLEKIDDWERKPKSRSTPASGGKKPGSRGGKKVNR